MCYQLSHPCLLTSFNFISNRCNVVWSTCHISLTKNQLLKAHPRLYFIVRKIYFCFLYTPHPDFYCLGLPKVHLSTACLFNSNASARRAIRSYVNSLLQTRYQTCALHTMIKDFSDPLMRVQNPTIGVLLWLLSSPDSCVLIVNRNKILHSSNIIGFPS